MTDGNTGSGANGLPYSANSNKAKKAEASTEQMAIAPVVQTAAVERQEPLRNKFFKAYANDTVGSVGAYLLMEVLVPATKNLISDLVTQGINRMLYGRSTASGNSFAGQQRQGYTRFSGSGGSSSSVGSQPAYNSQARAMHNTSQIIFATRPDAEMTLDSLREYIDRYGSVKLVNLYQAARVPINFTDQKWGWTDLSRASVQQVREGYIIDLPKTEVLP